MMGDAMGTVVVAGIIVCAITSGDTAFRSARLIVSDFMGMEQRSLRKRIYVSLPLFAVGVFIIVCLPFQTMWSYFAWSNQTLAVFTLWAATDWLVRHGKPCVIALLPAVLMTYVCSSYIFVSPLMFGMENRTAAYALGGAVALAISIVMTLKLKHDAKKCA